MVRFPLCRSSRERLATLASLTLVLVMFSSASFALDLVGVRTSHGCLCTQYNDPGAYDLWWNYTGTPSTVANTASHVGSLHSANASVRGPIHGDALTSVFVDSTLTTYDRCQEGPTPIISSTDLRAEYLSRFNVYFDDEYSGPDCFSLPLRVSTTVNSGSHTGTLRNSSFIQGAAGSGYDQESIAFGENTTVTVTYNKDLVICKPDSVGAPVSLSVSLDSDIRVEQQVNGSNGAVPATSTSISSSFGAGRFPPNVHCFLDSNHGVGGALFPGLFKQCRANLKTAIIYVGDGDGNLASASSALTTALINMRSDAYHGDTVVQSYYYDASTSIATNGEVEPNAEYLRWLNARIKNKTRAFDAALAAPLVLDSLEEYEDLELYLKELFIEDLNDDNGLYPTLPKIFASWLQNRWVDNGYKVILVGHSDGNLLVREALQWLELLGKREHVSAIAVAPTIDDLGGIERYVLNTSDTPSRTAIYRSALQYETNRPVRLALLQFLFDPLRGIDNRLKGMLDAVKNQNDMFPYVDVLAPNTRQTGNRGGLDNFISRYVGSEDYWHLEEFLFDLDILFFEGSDPAASLELLWSIDRAFRDLTYGSLEDGS